MHWKYDEINLYMIENHFFHASFTEVWSTKTFFASLAPSTCLDTRILKIGPTSQELWRHSKFWG